MKSTIKHEGNVDRFYGQKKAILVHVEAIPFKEISGELLTHLGLERPHTNRMVMVCTFRGDKGIPFVELRNNGSTMLMQMKKAIGQAFEIDYPVTDVKQEELKIDIPEDHFVEPKF